MWKVWDLPGSTWCTALHLCIAPWIACHVLEQEVFAILPTLGMNSIFQKKESSRHLRKPACFLRVLWKSCLLSYIGFFMMLCHYVSLIMRPSCVWTGRTLMFVMMNNDNTWFQGAHDQIHNIPDDAEPGRSTEPTDWIVWQETKHL